MGGWATDPREGGALLRGLFDAFAAGDVARIEGTFDDDVTWHAPGTNRFSGQFRGRAAVLERLATMREAGISTRFDVHDVVANEEHAIALVHLHLEVADGRRYDQQQVAVAHVRDGRIVEFWTMNQDQAVLDLLIG
ncbi:MAG TPA: nuclear transport factor 2 family protein [Actinomycetota bacterium]|nr:nuclear transport factor 2 family protein [Actinomycetota bacterium]